MGFNQPFPNSLKSAKHGWPPTHPCLLPGKIYLIRGVRVREFTSSNV
jgi:hypothetical protein